MPQYVAFLRGINVGGHRVKMDRLRGLFEELGFDDVSTFIASGNVVFSTESEDVDGLREIIERQLAEALGYEVATFLRSPAELAGIAAVDPSEAEESGAPTYSRYVIFLHAPASGPVRSELSGLQSEMDEFRFSDTEIHWRVQGKMTDSPLFAGGLDRAFRGVATTMRNMNTLRRILSKTEAGRLSPPAGTRSEGQEGHP